MVIETTVHDLSWFHIMMNHDVVWEDGKILPIFKVDIFEMHIVIDHDVI